MPFLLRAQALWNGLEQKSGDKLFHPCGVLTLGPQDSEFVTTAQRSAKNFNLNTELLSAEQIQQRWQEFTAPAGYVGLFEPDAGILRSELIVASYVRLAREAGCAQLFNCPVTAIEPIEQGLRS